LSQLAPDRLSLELLSVATNKQVNSYLRERALVTLGQVSTTNFVQNIIPLLDDETHIVYSSRMPNSDWKVCDRAAITIAILLKWEHSINLRFNLERREETIERVRKWANPRSP
jgi:hypothetical protein